MIEQQDVTGITIYLSQEKVSEIINALPSEQRRFSVIFANTVKHPHEIWQSWASDQNNYGNWIKLRTYLQYLDLSKTEINASYAVSIVQFSFNTKWKLYNMRMQTGDENIVIGKINQTIRNGDLMYSQFQH